VVGALEEGVVVQDMAQNVIWANEASGRLLGLTPEELGGTAPFPPTWRVVREDGGDITPEAFPGARAANSGRSVLRETMGVRRPDGSIAWVEAQAVPLRRVPDEAPYAVVTSFTDVTERKRQEDELRRAERQVSAVLEQAPSPVIGVAADGRITFANVRAGEVFGYRPEELVGQPMEVLVPDGLAEGHARLREAYIGHPVPRPMGIGLALQARRRDGTTLPVEIAINPVETPAGREVYATVVDISERRRIEAELLQAAKMDSVGRLAGGIAHDFNNLLTAIIGYGHIATTELPPTMSVRADVEEMVKAAERAADLTRQLLGFARKTILMPAPHDLNLIIDGLEPFLRRLIGEPVALVTNLDQSIGHIRVDRAQIDQILVNLAVNARDAMPQGGTLVVETSSLDAADVDSVLEVRGERIVVLSFSDTGTGMTEEVRLHAFEPFYTTKPFGQGTGLGLATTYGFVRQSGGAITIDSAPGAGTTFRIYFPEVVAVGAAVPATPKPVAEVNALRTVLVVEDEESVRTLVVRMLERAGYRVLQAPNGAAALSLVGTRLAEIDLLLSDIVMPGMRGPELFEVLRTARPDLRAVFMSGYPAVDEAGPRVSGRAPILAKPFTLEELVSAVAEGMGPGRAGA
jgi:PAS domain S-box-containing protein